MARFGPPPTMTLFVRLPVMVARALAQRAASEGMQAEEYVRYLIEQQLAEAA